MMEQHHLTPLSLQGIDCEANIVAVERSLHRHIHEKMNIPMRDYSRLMRDYRMRYNGRITVLADEAEHIITIQMMYFAGYSALCPLGQKIHVRTMNKYVFWLRDRKGHCHHFQPVWGKLLQEYCDALRAYYLD